MGKMHPPPRRRWFLWALASALIALTVMSAWRTLALRDELRSQVASQLEGQLQDRVSAWEEGIFTQLNDALEIAASNPADSWLAQAQIRQREAWFDSLYAWRPQRVVSVRGQLREEPAEFVFPLEPPSEGLDNFTRVDCLRKATEEVGNDADVEVLAEANLRACKKEPIAVRMFAASQSAVLLARQKKYEQAILALDSSGVDPGVSLRFGIQRGLDPYRLSIQRLQRADYLLKLGRNAEGLAVYEDTGTEIASLDAPELDDLVQYLRRPIIRELRSHGKKEAASRLESAAAQSERRLRAWEEIGQRILPRPPSRATEAPRFIYDQYSDTPFLLFYGPVRNGEMGAALQLDQPLLIADFLATMRRYRQHLVVTDAKGNWVAGARTGGPISVQVPFSQTLTHLRVGLRQGAVDESVARLDNQWALPLVVIAVFVILGLLALVAQLRADQRQEQLLIRQREFTARVTHELKTPLAGIRVIAENIEFGVYKTAQEQRDNARAIVREADRLAQRVDEILTVAKERKPPEPTLFDPEEAALEAIEDWGPRLQHAGVQLHADLHPVESIRGDYAAVRDAIACLLDNTLKYRNESRTDSQVWFSMKQDGSHVVIEVSDNGIGVPAAMRRSIFEKFVRVEGPHRGTAGGHGLGLALVKDVAKQHGGSAECWEGVDGGARFVVRLSSSGT